MLELACTSASEIKPQLRRWYGEDPLDFNAEDFDSEELLAEGPFKDVFDVIYQSGRIGESDLMIGIMIVAQQSSAQDIHSTPLDLLEWRIRQEAFLFNDGFTLVRMGEGSLVAQLIDSWRAGITLLDHNPDEEAMGAGSEAQEHIHPHNKQ